MQIRGRPQQDKELINPFAGSEGRYSLPEYISAAVVLHSLPDAVFITDPQMRIEYFNLAAEKITGFRSYEALGMYCKDILKTGICETECVVKRALDADQDIFNIETTITTVTGQTIPSLVSASLLRDADGKLIGYLYTFRDISLLKKVMSELEISQSELKQRNLELDFALEELKLAHKQLLQSQKMEAIGTLAGGIAHDFNNILTAIIGFGNLLKKEADKDDLMKTYVSRILTSAQRAANLTQSLLAFSRRQIINPKPVNLNEIVRGVENLLSRIIGEDIELKTIFTDQDLTVMADSVQIEQVLMNLATNARDAMPNGGTLIIKTERVELDNEFIKSHGLSRPGIYALISVEDTGQGIDEDTRGRIFEPFFTTKEVGKGTGLGLSMVYGLIKQHDGNIDVYSEPGKRTEFKIYLPLIKSAVEKDKEVIFPSIKHGTETVLIAEDDAQVREMIKAVLTGFGYTVLMAGDGEDAIRVFHENKDNIQLLIIDVIMPKKNGKEIYEAIKRVRPDIKAIFTSGYDANVIHKKGILEGGFEFISKPILPDEMLRKVRDVLDKKLGSN
jgi:PAS domain S-box-containing protein